MKKKTKGRDVSKMSVDELCEAGVPYLVDPDELKMFALIPSSIFERQEDGPLLCSIASRTRTSSLDCARCATGLSR
jgi:hypothetical protein